LSAVVGSSACKLQMQTNPMSKVWDVMEELTAKIFKEGEVEERAFQEYFAWCDDMAKNSGFEIKTAESKKEA